MTDEVVVCVLVGGPHDGALVLQHVDAPLSKIESMSIDWERLRIDPSLLLDPPTMCLEYVDSGIINQERQRVFMFNRRVL